MKEYKVENMVSYNGNKVPNQFIIEDYKNNITIFQSYETTIAMRTNEGIVLDTEALSYSATTSKYLYLFLNMSRKEILNDENIVYKNLN